MIRTFVVPFVVGLLLGFTGIVAVKIAERFAQ